MSKVIKLTQNKVALVDDEDFERVSAWSWYYHSGGYACNKGGISPKATYLHRLILDCPKGKLVDHINGNKLDNRKENLRIVTNSQNLMNQRQKRGKQSKYKGVGRDNRRNKWRSYITLDGKMIFLGYYTFEKEAALAYNEKATELFGEYAYLNVIKTKEDE